MPPSHTKSFPILSRGAPSPGSDRHFQNLLDKGTTTFNPDAIIKDFYRNTVEKPGSRLRVKVEYTATTTIVFPDSTIYGEIEPNLLFQTELLAAHYLVLSSRQREVVELRLLHGLEWSQVATRLNKKERMVQQMFVQCLDALRSYVFYDDGQLTWKIPTRHQLLAVQPLVN